MAKKKRFEKVYTQDGLARAMEILVDRETGVNYLLVQSGYGAGLTPLLDQNGQVVITPVSDDTDKGE